MFGKREKAFHDLCNSFQYTVVSMMSGTVLFHFGIDMCSLKVVELIINHGFNVDTDTMHRCRSQLRSRPTASC